MEIYFDVNQDAKCRLPKKLLLGGRRPMDVYLALDLIDTVLKYDTPIKGYKLIRLVCATQKSVSGTIYALDVQVADDNGGDLQNCSFEIIESLISSEKKTTEIDCDGKSPWKTGSNKTNVSVRSI